MVICIRFSSKISGNRQIIVAFRSEIYAVMSGKKKGLSHEEKRQRLLELLQEKKEPFQLKELEKLAPKEKGITSMSVKEVLQSLVDDEMVDSDKIGQMKKRKMTQLADQLDQSEQKKKRLEDNVKELKAGRPETEERMEMQSELAAVEAKLADLTKELANFAENDPEKLEQMETEATVAKEATNRWTDNILTAKKWCAKRFGMEEKELGKQFGIPNDFDYVE